MIVYRVENKEGGGPYYCWGEHHSSEWIGFDHNRNPGPFRDGGFSKEALDKLREDGWVFGFETLESLNQWFPKEELDLLSKFGFNVVEISATRVYKGNRQVIFYPGPTEEPRHPLEPR